MGGVDNQTGIGVASTSSVAPFCVGKALNFSAGAPAAYLKAVDERGDGVQADLAYQQLAVVVHHDAGHYPLQGAAQRDLAQALTVSTCQIVGLWGHRRLHSSTHPCYFT